MFRRLLEAGSVAPSLSTKQVRDSSDKSRGSASSHTFSAMIVTTLFRQSPFFIFKQAMSPPCHSIQVEKLGTQSLIFLPIFFIIYIYRNKLCKDRSLDKC